MKHENFTDLGATGASHSPGFIELRIPGLLGKPFSSWVGNLVNRKRVQLGILAHWIALELLEWYILLHTLFFMPTNHPASGQESPPFTICVCVYVHKHINRTLPKEKNLHVHVNLIKAFPGEKTEAR